MTKGHLDVKQLENMKKAELQELAEKLGVSTEGTVKELAARCAEVEAEVPDENEQTDKEKAAADGKVTVKVIQTYHDLQLKRNVEVGEQLEVSEERAAQLIEHKVAAKE